MRDTLQNWSDHSAEAELHSLIWVILNIIALLAGSGAMIGALSYSGHEPVNLWLIFGLFAVLPLLLTLFAALGSLLQRSYRSAHSGRVGLVVKVLRLPEQWLPYSRLMVSWSLWQSQSLALLFNVGALAGFFLVALFRDISFGWSSTLIEDTATMVSFFKLFTAPWNMLVSLPADETISATRFFQNQGISVASAGRVWWPTVVMAVLFYGVLPRLLLQQWLAARFRKALSNDISNSGEVERFLNGCQRVTTEAAAAVNEAVAEEQGTKTISVGSKDYCLIGWQNALQNKAVVYQLGLNSWQQDVQWVEETAATVQQPIVIVVDARQTPTGELADCIELMQAQGHSVSVGLLPEVNGDTNSGALRSWQYFVHQHTLEMLKVTELQHD